MKLDQLRYFVKIVDTQSITQAAKLLYMTQPALTASIQALEKELGIPLLIRSNKGTFPTDEGLQIYNDCKDILKALDEKIASWQFLTTHSAEPQGSVHIGAAPAAYNFLFSTVVPTINEQFPKINIVLHEIPAYQIAPRLSHEPYNLYLNIFETTMKEAEQRAYEEAGFSSLILAEDEYRVFLSVKNPLAAKSLLTYEEFQSLTFYTYLRTLDSVKTRTLNPSTRKGLNNINDILQSVADDNGAATFLYKLLSQNWYVKNGYIVFRPVAGLTLFPSNHCLIWRNENLSIAEQTILNYLKEQYPAFFCNLS